MAAVCVECSFVNVIGLDPNLMIPGSKVKLGKILRSMELIQHVIHCWNWEAIFHCCHVQTTIVCTKTPRAILFYLQVK
jgi:hypothetical protein